MTRLNKRRRHLKHQSNLIKLARNKVGDNEMMTKRCFNINNGGMGENVDVDVIDMSNEEDEEELDL